MIRRLAVTLAALALAAPLTLAQTSTWVPDKAHSSVDFTILHMSLSNVRGHFGNVAGSVVWNTGDITKSTINITVDVTTIDTGVSARDNDLKSPNFFDVAQFPTATFISSSISTTGGGLSISGNLTLHGVTKPIVLQASGPKGPVTGMDKKPHCGFSGTTTIKRTDFGIGAKVPTAVVGDDVALTFDLDLAKQ